MNPDKLLTEVAEYTAGPDVGGDEARAVARRCLMDSLGCALLALNFPQCTKLLGPIVPESTIAREADIVLPTQAGPEIGVASTKAFTCQLSALAALTIAAGEQRGTLSAEEARQLARALMHTPHLVEMMETPIQLTIKKYQPNNITHTLQTTDTLIHTRKPITNIPKQLIQHLLTTSHTKHMKLPFLIKKIEPTVKNLCGKCEDVEGSAKLSS